MPASLLRPVSADYNLHTLNKHFIWLFPVPQTWPKSNTCTDRWQTDRYWQVY